MAVDRGRSVLVLTDLQPDFMPGGALPVEEGDRVVGPVAALLERGLFTFAVATQDWHPPGHVSFASSHKGARPFDVIELYGHRQELWPDHCVQGTPGAELAAGVPWERVVAVVRKGTNPLVDSYSTFRNNYDPSGERPLTGLAGYLHERGVREVYLCGLARDFCVKWSAEDAVDAGFATTVLWDLTRPVDVSSDARVQSELLRSGIAVVDSREL